MSAGNIRIALSLSRPQLVQYLSARPADLRMRLREKELVTATEAARLADTQDSHGAVGQAQALVDILEKRTEEEIRGFMTGMEEYDERIQQLIEENLNGGMAVLEKLRDHLKKVYTTDRYHVIRSLPGEMFELDVKKGDYLMPLDFSVEHLEQEERQHGLLPSGEMDSRYAKVDFREVEEVLKALAESEDSRLAICTANAGTGKTVLIHRLVTQWMGDQDHMSNYVVVFSLHVRDVNISKSIIDILKDGNNQSGFVPQEYLSLLPYLLTSKNTASKILILLDGVDEKDIPQNTDISKLLRGEIYNYVRVLFTSRPEGTVFKTIKNLKPVFKIKINGTTRKGVYDYLRKIISKTTVSFEQEVELLIKECEEKMVEFEILQIPLYLTLIGFMLNQYWARKLSFKGFIVPRTVTQLFSAFMQVLMRVWLERIGRSEEAKVLMFNRSPIEKDSSVPIGIQGKLVAFGKMCFNNLLMKNYTFTNTDLRKYFIEEKDIKDCGLFCVSEDQEMFEFFLKHKQIQEYLAGVYLCSAQLTDSSFRDLVQSAEKNHGTLCLNDIFKDIEWTILFMFGLDTTFGLDILRQLETHVCVIKSEDGLDESALYRTDLGYEARLVTEANDSTVCEVMGEVLTSAQVQERTWYSFRAPVSSVYELCHRLTSQQRLTLLSQWYAWYNEGIQVTDTHTSHNTEVIQVTPPNTSHNTEGIQVTHTHTSHNTEGIQVTLTHTSHNPDVTQVSYPHTSHNTELIQVPPLHTSHNIQVIQDSHQHTSHNPEVTQVSRPHTSHNPCTGVTDPHTSHNPCTGVTDPHTSHNPCTGVTDPLTSHNPGTGVPHPHTSHNKGTEVTQVKHPHTSHNKGTESKISNTCLAINKLGSQDSTNSNSGSEDSIDGCSKEKKRKMEKLKSLICRNREIEYIEFLDMVHYFLLCEFTFPSVQSLDIEKSLIYDVGLIQRLFPALLTLCIDGGRPDQDAALDTVMCSAPAEPPATLTDVMMTTLPGATDNSLPPCSVRSLLRLHHLHTLKLGADMMISLNCDDCDTSWPLLHTLEICLRVIIDDNAVSVWEELCLLLTRTPALTQLTFGCLDNYTQPTPQTTAALQSLLQHLTHQSPHLHTLRLYNVLHPCDMEAVCAGLAELTQVTTLGLGWTDVRGDLDWGPDTEDCDESVLRVISRGVRSAPHVTHIEVLHGEQWFQEVPASHVGAQLMADCPHVHIDTYQWDLIRFISGT